MAGFERFDASVERSSAVGKMLSDSFASYREIIHKRMRQSTQYISSFSYFKKLSQPSQPSTTTTVIGQQPSTWRQDPPPAKRPQFAEDSEVS